MSCGATSARATRISTSPMRSCRLRSTARSPPIDSRSRFSIRGWWPSARAASSSAAPRPSRPPLSSRFDEVDATVVFHDVFVPWEQVFVYRNVDLVNAQFHESPSHTLANFQSLVRFSVKLEFMAGLAMKLVELHSNEKNAAAQATLGGDIEIGRASCRERV